MVHKKKSHSVTCFNLVQEVVHYKRSNNSLALKTVQYKELNMSFKPRRWSTT